MHRKPNVEHPFRCQENVYHVQWMVLTEPTKGALMQQRHQMRRILGQDLRVAMYGKQLILGEDLWVAMYGK